MAADSPDILARQALDLVRNELTLGLRFMRASFSRLTYLPQQEASLATDGTYLRYDPAAVARAFAEDKTTLSRDYLHILLHNVLLHPFPRATMRKTAWDAACDIAVERLITDLDLPASRAERTLRQRALLARIEPSLPAVTAEAIYRLLIDQNLSDNDIMLLREPFYADDHEPWHRMAAQEAASESGKAAGGSAEEGKGSASRALDAAKSGTDMAMPEQKNTDGAARSSQRGMSPDDIVQKQMPEQGCRAEMGRFADTVNLDRSREQWKNAAYEMGVQLDSYAKLWGIEGSNLSMNLRVATREKRDFREFLRKFARMGEQLRVNDDEFDYVYYCYGLKRYGNLPLIEPIEYVEERRIRDFVIAIDTSASTKDGLVRRFVERTYSILSNETSFFSDMNVHIVQCDAAVADVTRIANLRDLEDYLANLEIKGLGGTDFRPVFAYVDDALERGELTNLGGLLYFTDGQGTYPARKPAYDVAFVFADDASAEASAPIPAWAMKVALDDTFIADD